MHNYENTKKKKHSKLVFFIRVFIIMCLKNALLYYNIFMMFLFVSFVQELLVDAVEERRMVSLFDS